MSLVNELARFIYLTEKISPKCRKSALWRRSRDNLLKNAVIADLATRWVDEYQVEDEIYEEPYKDGDLRATLDEVLGK